MLALSDGPSTLMSPTRLPHLPRRVTTTLTDPRLDDLPRRRTAKNIISNTSDLRRPPLAVPGRIATSPGRTRPGRIDPLRTTSSRHRVHIPHLAVNTILATRDQDLPFALRTTTACTLLHLPRADPPSLTKRPTAQCPAAPTAPHPAIAVTLDEVLTSEAIPSGPSNPCRTFAAAQTPRGERIDRRCLPRINLTAP